MYECTKGRCSQVVRVIGIGIVALIMLSFTIPGLAVDKPHAGKTLNLMADMGNIGQVVKKFAARWCRENGVKLAFSGFTQAEGYSKLMIECKTGTLPYDAVQIWAHWWGDFDPYFLNLDDRVAKLHPNWQNDLLPMQSKTHTFGGRIKGIQFDGDTMFFYYRKDLFEHPEERKAFKQEYGYELPTRMTWDQYLDVAEFFTRKPGETLAGEVLTEPFYGAIDQNAKWGIHTWFLLRYYNYAGSEPDVFDPETMKPRINGPAGIKALEHFKKSLDYAPPGSLEYDVEQIYNEWTNGHLAMLIWWDDFARWVWNPDWETVIKGKQGFDLVPGADVAGKRYHWTSLCWGPSLGIPKTSKNADMAWDFIIWFSGPEIHAEAVLDLTGGIQPARYSTIWQKEIRKQVPVGYLTAHAECTLRGVPDLRIHSSSIYYTTLAMYVQRAFSGELSPKEALDGCAKKWEEITESVGREIQKELYLNHLGSYMGEYTGEVYEP